MSYTYFQDFISDDGDPITVEYSFAGGSDTNYSPLHGASGGDGYEVEIIKAWGRNDEKDVALSDAEYERMCNWLAEHHVDEPDEDDYL